MPKSKGYYGFKAKKDDMPMMGKANMPGVASESPRKAMLKGRGKGKKKGMMGKARREG